MSWPRQGLEGTPGPVSSQGGSGRAWRQPGPVTSQGDPNLVLQGGALVIPNLEDASPYFSEILGRLRLAGSCLSRGVDAVDARRRPRCAKVGSFAKTRLASPGRGVLPPYAASSALDQDDGPAPKIVGGQPGGSDV